MATSRRIIMALLLLSLLVLANQSDTNATEQTNFLRNPGFEEIGFWRTLVADANDVADPRNTNQSHNGKYSAYTKATTINGDGYAFVYQNVSIPVTSSMEFSFWLYVRHPDLPFYGYIKGFITTSTGKFFELGIWSDLPKPEPNQYQFQTRLERYDSWFRVSVDLGRLWVDEAKFPRDDTITAVSLGIYNGLVYALPKNLLHLEVFFDDVFLGAPTSREESRFPWLLGISGLVGVTMVIAVILIRLRRFARTSPISYEELTPKIKGNQSGEDDLSRSGKNPNERRAPAGGLNRRRLLA